MATRDIGSKRNRAVTRRIAAAHVGVGTSCPCRRLANLFGIPAKIEEIPEDLECFLAGPRRGPWANEVARVLPDPLGYSNFGDRPRPVSVQEPGGTERDKLAIAVRIKGSCKLVIPPA